MNSKIKTLLITLTSFVLLGSFCYVFATINLFDADFWWHIATGRYIVETATLPDKDPFSFTSTLAENKNLLPVREMFLLKQYWLGQVLMFLTYNYAGPQGIIIFRAFILAAVLFLVLWQLKAWSVSFYISFPLVFLVYLDALRYTGERPVLFTVLLTPLVFIILEKFKENRGKTIFFLIPVMLFWANLHGGFIIGNIIIFVYMFCEGIKMVFKKAPYTRNEIAIFYIATTLAVAASFINPAGWDAFSIALSQKYKFLEAGIQEYQSPLILYINKLASIHYGYVILALLFPLVLILRNKKMDLTHFVLLAGLFYMAAKAGRYSIFYTSIAAMVFGKELEPVFQNLFQRIPEHTYKKIVSVFISVAFLSSILFFIGVFKFQWLKLDIARGIYVPVGAVNFIEENKLSGNMFNSHPYGGYLAWRLYPWKKTFIDTRWLNNTLQSEYAWITGAVESVSGKSISAQKTPLWKRLLDHYKINFIILDTLDVYGTVPKVLLVLASDKDWVPIYCEPIAVIFIKNTPENKSIIEKFRRPKEDVYNTVISLASYTAIFQRENPKYLITLGKTFYEMGRLHAALTAYQYAYKRFPKEQGLKEKIAQVESEIEKEKHERD